MTTKVPLSAQLRAIKQKLISREKAYFDLGLGQAFERLLQWRIAIAHGNLFHPIVKASSLDSMYKDLTVLIVNEFITGRGNFWGTRIPNSVNITISVFSTKAIGGIISDHFKIQVG